MSLRDQKVYDVGPCRLIPAERVLLRDGQPVALPPKAYDLLLALLTRAGHLVTKEELLKEVWPETFVEEANLSYTVSLLRKALGDENEPHRYIETVPKRGYRFKAAVVTSPVGGGADEPENTPRSRRRLPWVPVAGAATGVLLLASTLLLGPREKGSQPPVARLQLLPPQGVVVENAQISPDGRRIAFSGRDGESRKLWIQALDSATASPVQGIDGGANNLFWAPDGQQLAFTFGGILKKVDLARGAVQTVCEGNAMAGTWSRHGVILFHVGGLDPTVPRHLSRVPASGGVPVPATKLDSSKRELSHSSPHFLPDGKHFLYVVQSFEKNWSGLFVGSLDSAQSKRLLDRETAAIYAPPGYLLYSRDGAIVAHRFDVAKLELAGEPIPIAHDAEYQSRVGTPQFSTSTRSVPGFTNVFLLDLLGAAVFSAAENGLLAYSVLEPSLYQFGWFDRQGVALGDVGTPGPFSTFDLSSDGKWLVVARPNVDRANLWLFDLDRNVGFSQLTFGRSFEFDPRWGPDGRRVVASVVPEDADRRIVEIGLDGRASVLFGQGLVDDWSRDGRFLLLHRNIGLQGRPLTGLQALPLFGDRSPILVREMPSGVDQARFSPDGRLIAYHSGTPNGRQVHLERFPPTGERLQVSADGVGQPVWRRDGRELYYVGRDGTLFAVEIDGRSLGASKPRPLFRVPVVYPEGYTTLDGNRFLVMKPVPRTPRSINVVVNWPALTRDRSRQ